MNAMMRLRDPTALLGRSYTVFRFGLKVARNCNRRSETFKISFMFPMKLCSFIWLSEISAITHPVFLKFWMNIMHTLAYSILQSSVEFFWYFNYLILYKYLKSIFRVKINIQTAAISTINILEKSHVIFYIIHFSLWIKQNVWFRMFQPSRKFSISY